MKIDLGNWGHGDRKGTGLFGQIEETLRDHPLRLNLSQQGKSQLAAAAPLLLAVFGYRHVEGNIWERVEPELEPGAPVDGMAETLSDRLNAVAESLADRIDGMEQRILAMEASEGWGSLIDQRLGSLSDRVAALALELQSSMASMAEAKLPQPDRGILGEDLAEVIARRLDKLEEQHALERDADLERHEERLLAIEAGLAKLQNPDRSQLDALRTQVSLLSAKVAELQSSAKGRAKKE